ncbi:transporter substrate-binding domain-containing protein [Azoarcus sp. KH32C]|uniref:transporter substrate-binding domain-containing protein n=1 Tax=Azoarcus sp. KH32C TaxID=748247 RepID=UPI0002385E15|nr:transporter substrate-binding domain-containing protein [Azoarcus sp. KH32C]BAL27200.1 extracellular solute-binding protein family 3, putative glutamine transport system substrate-binding protein [Azoarcus sp. KH32C]
MNTSRIAIAVLALGLAGPACVHADMPAAAPQAGTQPPSDSSPTMARIKERGKILVGNKFGFQTFNYKNATGRNEGYMADLARALAKRILGDESKVEFRQTTDETRFEMLARNEIDVILDITPSSAEKLMHVDFTEEEIFRSGSGLLVKKGSPIKGLKDLRKGTRVLYVMENKDIDKLKALAPEATYIPFDDSKQAFAALKAAKGEVFTQVVTHLYRAASQDPNYTVVNRFTDKPYYIAVRKGDSEMREYLDDFLRSMKASGEYNRLFQKWFGPLGGDAA